uniref:RNA polymerase II-associated protein 3 isoform X1 n=1 Tax=Tanacetum cinerariifolium TaxID=118510 RepID=A0A6L2LR47_TANCI|nr:RNA polymerase II-associated protein 3 isoform X1 [Tanacetum cinerariifolium]
MATKGNLGEVVTTCERSWVQASPWGFSFRSEKGVGLSHKAKIRVLHTAQLDFTKIRVVGVERRNMDKSTSVHSSVSKEEDYLKKYDATSHLSSGFISNDSSVYANSEKELGNDFFKKRKYKEAVDCYSMSLALSSTAIAYSYRAMAYLKIRRFHEAEDDYTEALNLDDRYTKAYSDSDYAGASMDIKSTTGGCQILVCRLISWQCKKQTLVETSSTEAEYVAAASCCAQVL